MNAARTLWPARAVVLLVLAGLAMTLGHGWTAHSHGAPSATHCETSLAVAAAPWLTLAGSYSMVDTPNDELDRPLPQEPANS